MFYNKEEKQFLGRYFKYYREKQGIKLNDVVKLGICDYKTYKGIEEGIAKPSNDFYDKLIEFYGIDASVLITLEEIKPMLQELYDACEWYDKERIEKNIKYVKNITNSISNKLLIRELYDALSIVCKEYLLDEYLNEEEILVAFKLIRLFDNNLSSLLIEACGRSNLNHVCSHELFELMIPLVNREDSICKYWKAKMCITNVNYIEATNLFEELIENYRDSKNLIREMRISMSLFNVYRDVDFAKAEQLLAHIENCVNHESVPFNLKSSIFYNLGMYYYLNDNYTKALFNYKKSNELNKDLMTTLFICSCQSHLEIYEYVCFDFDETHIYAPYLKYFKKKFNDVSKIELEKYVIDCLIDHLMQEKYEQPFWSMFNYEMSKLVKQTRNYKKFHYYHEMFQKATKTAL